MWNVDVYNKIYNTIYIILHSATKTTDRNYYVENIYIFRFVFCYSLHLVCIRRCKSSLIQMLYNVWLYSTIEPYIIRMICWKWEYYNGIILLNIYPKASSLLPVEYESRYRKTRGVIIHCKSYDIYNIFTCKG